MSTFARSLESRLLACWQWGQRGQPGQRQIEHKGKFIIVEAIASLVNGVRVRCRSAMGDSGLGLKVSSDLTD